MRWLAALAMFAAGISHSAPEPESLCSRAVTIFCSGFEEGSFGIWDDYDGNPAPWNTLVLEPGPLSLSDNTVARVRVPEGRGGHDVVKILPSQHDRLFVRWYQKWESGYDFNADNHGGGFHAGHRDYMGRSGNRPTGSDWFSAWMEPVKGRLNLYAYYRGMYQDCADPNGSCWGDHFPCFLDDGGYCKKPEHRERIMPPLLQTNRWYCLEVEMNAGTPTSTEAGANGSLNYWIDGVEYGPWTGLWFRTTSNLKINIFSLGLFFHNTHTSAGHMYDNIVVSTERIGCLDSPRPNAPSSLTAN